MERGVVLSPDFCRLPTGGAFFKSAVDDFELRKYLMYWDKIEVPLTTTWMFECQQFDQLQAEGILKQTPYALTNNRIGRVKDSFRMTLPKEAGDEILSAHEEVFRVHNFNEPGVWSKAQLSSSVVSSGSIEKESVEFELYDLVPVPSADTPLQDILKFKETRHDELIAFRIYLDEMYQSIIGAVDIPRAKNTELNRLEQSLRDVNRVLKESKIKSAVSSLKSVISGVDGIIGVGVGVASAPLIPFSPIIAGTVAAGVCIGAKMVMHNNDTTPKELTYIKSIRKQFS